MLTNKHVIVAMIVAPILAVIAYFATDAAVSETPQAALAGQSYQLVAGGNCRYKSGICSMKNGDVKLDIIWQSNNDQAGQIVVQSNYPLQGAKVALGTSQPEPISLVPLDDSNTRWQLLAEHDKDVSQPLKVVIGIDETLYFGEADTVFFDYETSFGKDFRAEAIQ